MSEFEKELEKNMKLRKIAYEREGIESDSFVSKWDIERIFHDWQPPKSLVVVPKFVADYIKTQKDNDYDGNAFLILKHYESFKQDGNDSELDMWIATNFNDFLEAIVNGYTVEKEQLYKVVFLKTDDDEILLLKSDTFFIDWITIYNDLKYQFTEAEIKAIDERYWTFAVPVEEVHP